MKGDMFSNFLINDVGARFGHKKKSGEPHVH